MLNKNGSGQFIGRNREVFAHKGDVVADPNGNRAEKRMVKKLKRKPTKKPARRRKK